MKHPYLSLESSKVQSPPWLSRLAASVRRINGIIRCSNTGREQVFFSFLKNLPEQTTCSGSRPPCCPQWATNFDLPELEISPHLFKNKQKKKKYFTLKQEIASAFVNNTTLDRQVTAHQRKGCCPEARGGPLWSLAALGGSCGAEEIRTLGNAAGSPTRYEPRDLRDTCFHRWVQALLGVRSCLWHHCLHFPCFLFSSISILLSRRFSSLSFFCLTRFRFSSSSSNKNRPLNVSVCI